MKKDLKTVENEFAGRQSQTMELKTNSTAGTMESSDIMIMLEPRTEGGIELELTSSVMQQFGKQIRKVILDTLQEYDVQNAKVEAVDKGALDCTVRARTVAAIYRAAQRLPLGSLNGFILGRKDAFAEQSIETFNILMRNKASAKADIRKCTLKIV